MPHGVKTLNKAKTLEQIIEDHRTGGDYASQHYLYDHEVFLAVKEFLQQLPKYKQYTPLASILDEDYLKFSDVLEAIKSKEK